MSSIKGLECEDFDDGKAGVEFGLQKFFTTEARRHREKILELFFSSFLFSPCLCVSVVSTWFDSTQHACKIEKLVLPDSAAFGPPLHCSPDCHRGGIGRRAWFRSMYRQRCGGSSPFDGTKDFFRFESFLTTTVILSVAVFQAQRRISVLTGPARQAKLHHHLDLPCLRPRSRFR